MYMQLSVSHFQLIVDWLDVPLPCVQIPSQLIQLRENAVQHVHVSCDHNISYINMCSVKLTMYLYAYTAIIDCRLVLCAKPQCPNPIPANPAIGKCCPTCPGRLLPAGKYITKSKHWFGINFTDLELMPVYRLAL